SVINTFISSHRNRRQGIEHIVVTGDIERNFKHTGTVLAQHLEVGAHAVHSDLFGPNVSLLVYAISNGWTGDGFQNVAYHRIIHAHHCQAIKWQVMQKLD